MNTTTGQHFHPDTDCTEECGIYYTEPQPTGLIATPAAFGWDTFGF